MGRRATSGAAAGRGYARLVIRVMIIVRRTGASAE
jgi:hypothetical protein